MMWIIFLQSEVALIEILVKVLSEYGIGFAALFTVIYVLNKERLKWMNLYLDKVEKSTDIIHKSSEREEFYKNLLDELADIKRTTTENRRDRG